MAMTALTQLIHILESFGLTDTQLQAQIAEVVVFRDYQPGQIIIRTGERPTHCFFILQGLSRYYYLAPDGKQWNKAFFHEGQAIGSFSAYLLNQPCSYSIEAVESCWLASVPLSFIDQRLDSDPQVRQMFEHLTRFIMLRNEQREAMLLTCNNEGRYRWLLEHEPWLLGRVPQYQLASYLSMDPVSFSRIKHKQGSD